MLSPRLQLLRESLQKLLRRNAGNHVERLLVRTRAADVAVVMRFLDERQQGRVFDLLPDDDCRADTLAELDDHLVSDLIGHRSERELAPIIAAMSADDQADILALLPEKLRTSLIDALRPADKEEVEDLLHYDAETAGGIMSPEFFALPSSTTVSQAIQALQASDDVEMAFYIYVVNDPGHLVGVVSLRALVTHPPTATLETLMVSDVISVVTNTDQEEVARLAARYNLLAIPVVDEANSLVGIVTIDDVIDVIREEATEDILKMAGADETAYENHSVLRNFRTRAPWLFATWLGGLSASVLISAFEYQLQATVALAAFIPIVLGMGGNVGIQTATIIVRGLATGHVSEGVGLQYLWRETIIGVFLGVLYGTLIGLYTAVAYGDSGAVFQLSLTVGLSVLASMASSAAVGAFTPLLFDRMRIDPAIATGPIVTTSVDVLGILVYFWTATLIIGTPT
ncbi:MAG: magnesium transporter [Myxococcota bacterium]|nr:magnesium transporter [Myxococcota bacterium]